ncbi:MAG: hypothetical protein GF344_12950 [Chitinivibrionales bacterium]|nr:hypothetical protein [Chitinivibrionales bacterium]
MLQFESGCRLQIRPPFFNFAIDIHNEDDLLASCYRNSLALVRDNGLESIAFPAISTGVYRFPLDRACRIALQEIDSFLKSDSPIEKVVLVCFDERTYRAYKQLTER